MKYYTREHQWIELAGDVAVVGISQYASDELGTLSYVELPKVGATVSGGKVLCVVESLKACSDVFMPVTGTICEVNTLLETKPELVNDSPEGDGWICKAKGVDEAAVKNLMTADAYKALTAK